MLRLLKKLRRNERANVLILTAFSMPLLIGSAGLAVDTIQWTLWKRQLQRAADSAAIAGVYERQLANDTAGVPTAVLRDVAITQQTGIALLQAIPTTCPATASGGTTPVLLCPANVTVGTVNRRSQVQVQLQVRRFLPFSSMFIATPPTIVARATAAAVGGGGEYCVIGLDDRPDKTAITIGGSTTVDMGTCSLMSNSTHPSAAATNGGSSANSIVRAASIAAVGGVAFSSRWTVGAYEPGTPAVKDPYGAEGRNLTPPPQNQCGTNLSGLGTGENRSTVDSEANGARKVVCINGEAEIKGNVVLGSATYVINGGDLKMSQSNASLSCSQCTIILTNYANPAASGDLQITGGTLNITPPTNGTYEGISIFQDRRASDNDSSSPQNKINGNSSSNVQGVVYTPGRSISMLGGGTAAAPVCLQVVGRRVEFTGNSYIQISSLCGAHGMDANETEPLVRLVA
jgi:Flp pilus assembly protein TadG